MKESITSLLNLVYSRGTRHQNFRDPFLEKQRVYVFGNFSFKVCDRSLFIENAFEKTETGRQSEEI